MRRSPVLLIPCLSLLLVSALPATDLTPQNIESIRAKLKTMKESLDNHLTSRNSTAGQTFADAASDPRKAVALYLKCIKLVNFDREDRPESDYRAWEDSNSDRLRDEAFVESLQMQLRYLALSCEAAETDEIDSLFGALLTYVDGLSHLEEMPTANLTRPVSGSIFADAYYLQKLLGDNPGWEPVPFNIGGIYEKTIFPHLRQENPSALMSAWDKRIEQETRIVLMLDEHKEKQLRGLDRDQQRRVRGRQDSEGGLMGSLDKDDFQAETLPRMQWEKLKDMFVYVDEVEGAKAILPFLEEHITHKLGEDFFRDFETLLNDAGVGSNNLKEDTTTTESN